MPVRRVSLWRDASSARFTLTRFPFLCQPTLIQFLRRPVSRGLFARMFPFCEGVFSMPVCRVSRFAPMLIECASIACSMRSIYICGHLSFLRRSVFLCTYLFFAYFSFGCRIVCIISLLILSTCHLGYTIPYLFISRLRLQNGCATQRDVCFVSVQKGNMRTNRYATRAKLDFAEKKLNPYY